MYVNANLNIGSDVEPIPQQQQQQQQPQQQQQKLPISSVSHYADRMPGDYTSAAYNARRGALNGGYSSILKLGTTTGGGNTNMYLDPSTSSSGSINARGAKSAAAVAAGAPFIAQRNPIYQPTSQTASGFSSVASNDTLNAGSVGGPASNSNNNNNNPGSNSSNGVRTTTMMKPHGIPQAIMNAKLMAPGAAAGVVKGSNQPRVVPQAASPFDYYKNRKDASRKRVLDKYDIIGYIAAGTYGRVYKATSKDVKSKGKEFAIKKFKVDSKDGEIPHYTGISQSACREMALCCELHHKNVTRLVEIILEDKCIFMIFEYAEHDLLQIIHYHSHPDRRSIPEPTVKSILWQLLNGASYLHQNWVLHRDLKPANIMVSTDGQVKIGDLGLARIFHKPQQSLYVGDKIVVTIWYRAPELLFGARHYTPAIDLWAIGCIFAELLALRPIFKGDEEKLDNKKNMPFQRNQIQKIIDVLGTPSKDKWPDLPSYPEYPSLSTFKQYPSNLESWYYSVGATNPKGLNLLSALFEYDPTKRITAEDALKHPYFSDSPRFTEDAFASQEYRYPRRGIQTEDVDIKTGSQPNTKRLIAEDRGPAASKKKKRK